MYIFAVVFVIWIVYLLYKNYTKKKSITELAEDSAGVFDEPTATALKIEPITGRDHFTRGRLLWRNVVYDENTPTEIVRDVLHDARENFIIAIEDQEIIQDPIAVDEIDIFQNMYGEITNRNLVQEHVKSIVAEAKSARKKPRKAQVKSVVSRIGRIQNDNQNVHDSLLNKQMANLYQKLPTNPITPEEIFKLIESADVSDSVRENAKTVAQHMISENIKVSAVGANEGEVLRRVVGYIQKHKNCEGLKDTLALQLDDARPEGSLVCPNGRVARVIGVISGVDDNAIGTVQMYKHEFTKRAEEVYNNLADSLPEAKDFIDGNSNVVPEEFRQKFRENVEVILDEYKGRGVNIDDLRPLANALLDV